MVLFFCSEFFCEERGQGEGDHVLKSSFTSSSTRTKCSTKGTLSFREGRKGRQVRSHREDEEVGEAVESEW